ncbi:DUF2249 domain-containing protein [Rhodococcus sp. HNM0563]|uniref:DUF2249 domain-containing protein n=1 Tax=unclassified Rhodococcus (in: high G+C Gram-positive bacteria) TaxID=192944 RepID=UPI00146B0224|nr:MULTISPECIES: DUF2249 domain-containing protein [unclassified Rhodococcus (in: high G+C Gram-positive bacteria)]MCK0089200.1 DUF2249 domain-containing protein [Rhodococcus sp. F64268]NLU62744.1 DUF2249 domain-containing protein [Rhodococcus sp. HNM0563]
MSADQIVVATTAEDARAVDAVKSHHSELAGHIAILSEALLDAAATGKDVDVHRRAMVDFLTGSLLPHATAEERVLYPAAAGRGDAKLLVESMIAVHRLIAALVDRIAKEPDPVRAAAAAHALRVVFDLHLVDENDRILPLVAADPDVSLAGILEGMHELLGGDAQPEHDGHVCACGERDEPSPVLDVREIPHAIRHATVFGAFDAVPERGTLLLVAPHDPIPLLRQLTDRVDGRLGVDYEERGPEAWRVRLTRIPDTTSA